jgi:pantothenate kinase
VSQRRRTFADLDGLVDELAAEVQHSGVRFMLGVAGPPGAGKSTAAAQIVARASHIVSAFAVPMDGFHRSNDDLVAAGLLPLKGVPATFDAPTFVAHLEALRGEPLEPIAWPTYDRSTESVVPGGATISPEASLIVVEGNYLLLDEPPWDRVRRLLDAVWYLDVPDDVLVPRLQARHECNRSPAEAAAKVAGTDLPNARLVAGTKHRADMIVALD